VSKRERIRKSVREEGTYVLERKGEGVELITLNRIPILEDSLFRAVVWLAYYTGSNPHG